MEYQKGRGFLNVNFPKLKKGNGQRNKIYLDQTKLSGQI
jgi:hypothetical protein